MDPVFELAIDLPPKGSRSQGRALHAQLRSAILDGRLKPGLQLPASRALAARLGLARNSVVSVYDLLIGEGYLETRAGAGTFVPTRLPAARPAKPAADDGPDPRLRPYWRDARPQVLLADNSLAFDLRLGLPDKSLFPFEIWRRLSNRALRELGRAPARYMAADGQPRLREAIARHVSFARAVACGADDIVVTTGAQQAFDLIARILVDPGRTTVAVEDPGYPPLREAFAHAGARIAPVPVDEEGLIVDRLPRGAHIVCVTPSHQFPLGVPMSPTRRLALLDFARRHDAVIVEDDYDGEFRFGGRPLDALQTLDHAGSVLYVGTFSKSLFPALRLGYVAAPAWARPALVAARRLTDWHGPALAEHTLAAFIAEGHLARHVRRMRKVYDARRTTLLDALARHMPALKPIPAVAGLHIAARLPDGIDADRIVARAAEAGVGIESLGRYAIDERNRPNGLAFGYGSIATAQIEPAVRRLVDLLGPVGHRTSGRFQPVDLASC